MRRALKSTCATSHQGPASGKIEHRLFSAISQNWRGKPLSHEVVVNLIGANDPDLRVQSQLDTNRYPAGRTVSDDELGAI